jgi:hypothetical protein
MLLEIFYDIKERNFDFHGRNGRLQVKEIL